MNPLLVDSCKNSKIVPEEQIEEKPLASTSTKSNTEEIGKTPIEYFHDEALTKIKFLQTYEETYSEVMLDPNGIYISSQIILEEEMFSQMLQKRPKIKIDSLYHKNLKGIVYQIVKKFLVKHIGTSLKKATIQIICEKTFLTMFALFSALENCYENKNILEQFYNSYHFPTKVLDLFRNRFPYTENLPAFRTEDFEMMTSPMTPNQEDELFLASTFSSFAGLIDGNKEVGRLFAMLVMFTPFGANLTNEETLILKQFQSQVSIILFNQILSQDKEDILTASKRFGDFVSIVKDLNKCGFILSNMLFVPDVDDLNITNIEDIAIISIEAEKEVK